MHAFVTPRLHLRPLAEGDEALYCSLYTDPQVMRYIAAPMPLAAARRSFRAACRLQSPRPQRWIISQRSAGNGGDIGLLGLFANGDEAEIGVMLLPDKHGQGFSAEAIMAMADRMFSAKVLRLLWTRHMAANGLAMGLMQKLGFVCEGAEDGEHAQLRWQLPREPWLARRLGGSSMMAISDKAE